MATFKVVATAKPDAASNTSLTSAFQVPGEFSHFAVLLPANFAITATCGVRILGSDSLTGTYRDVIYSNNPATATSGLAPWQSPGSAAVSGAFVICEALQFVPFAKLQFQQTCTANTGFVIYGKKFD